MKLAIATGVLLILVIAVSIGVATVGLFPRGTPLDRFAPEARFVPSWENTLFASRKADEARREVLKNKEGGEVVEFDDGTWIAVVMEHECCTGAGFNATLYVTSNQESYLDAKTCYCGFFPLASEIQKHSTESISAFLSDVRSNGITLTKR